MHAMDTITLDPGSFKDPDGGIFFQGERVYRYLTLSGAEKFLALTSSGLLDRLDAQGMVIGQRQIRLEEVPGLRQIAPQAKLVIEHPRLPFISYCYEWSFEMLKSVALLTLEMLPIALEKGFILKDATPYNVQFVGIQPVFVDLASFEPYKEGQPWKAYHQFCCLFLNPLLLQAFTGVRFQPWLRGSLGGITPEELSRLLPWPKKLRPGVFPHVVLQSWINRRFAEESIDVTNNRPLVNRQQIAHLISQLQKTVKTLKPGRAVSNWTGYEGEPHYHPEATALKEAFVERVLEAQKPKVVWDLGANTGHYSIIAARHVDYIVAMDSDADAIDQLYHRARGRLAKILPLVIDLSNPSPDAGWAQNERRGLSGRGPADMALYLALVHHLAIAGNVPFRNLISWLARIAKGGIIEFVPKDDPKVQELLRWKDDIYNWYSQENFEAAVRERFQIAEWCPLPHSGRILYHFTARDG